MAEDKKIIAPLCKKDHSCRSGQVYCRPAFPIDGNYFYFVGQGDEECPYNKIYGSLHTCDCPVRLEIYQRYKI